MVGTLPMDNGTAMDVERILGGFLVPARCMAGSMGFLPSMVGYYPWAKCTTHFHNVNLISRNTRSNIMFHLNRLPTNHEELV